MSDLIQASNRLSITTYSYQKAPAAIMPDLYWRQVAYIECVT